MSGYDESARVVIDAMRAKGWAPPAEVATLRSEVERLTKDLAEARAASRGADPRAEALEEAARLCDESSDSDVVIVDGRRYLPQRGERAIGKRIRALASLPQGSHPDGCNCAGDGACHEAMRRARPQGSEGQEVKP